MPGHARLRHLLSSLLLRSVRPEELLLTLPVLPAQAEVTIGPKWAYRKGGVQDDEGGYVIPPNATLVFHMELVGVRGKMLGPG